MGNKLHIKVGDTVMVVAGNEKGNSGKVLGLNSKRDRATVEGLNMTKKHVKPSATSPQGGIEENEGGIHISNLMVIDSKGVPSRTIRKSDANGKTVRFSVKSNTEVK
ncbi:MAG: 50S ribosomal protein L24 [Salibacteraceae bacterium]